MKHLILALVLILSVFNIADARLYTEAEAAAECQAEMDEMYRHPENLSAEECRRRELQHSIETNKVPKNFYNGSGSYVSDRDVYIDGKLYHCVQYQFNTQCHID